MNHDPRAHAPATLRNREPILVVLRRLLPGDGGPRRVLEIASGTGEHAAYFACELPHVTWQPSDLDASALVSIAAWREAAGSPPNLLPPLELDVTAPWPVALGSFDTIFSANMIHIAPWEACVALFGGAARMLSRPAHIIIYGPFALGGAHTAPSNAAFDQSLRMRDPRWGVRDLDEVRAVAAAEGFAEVERVAMPANNLMVVFRAG